MVEEICQLFAEGFMDAGENFSSASTENSTDGEILFDSRNGKGYNKKSTYNEFSTLTMQWANAATTQEGDIKVFNQKGKFYLMEADGDGGCIELANGPYKKVRNLYEQLRREIDTSSNSIYEDSDTIRNELSGNWGNNGYSGQSDDRGNQRATERSKLRSNASAGDEHNRQSSKGKQKVKFGFFFKICVNCKEWYKK